VDFAHQLEIHLTVLLVQALPRELEQPELVEVQQMDLESPRHEMYFRISPIFLLVQQQLPAGETRVVRMLSIVFAICW